MLEKFKLESGFVKLRDYSIASSILIFFSSIKCYSINRHVYISREGERERLQ